MGSLRILLGKTRVRRRRGLAHRNLVEEAFSGEDPWGRPNYLYLTDTVRKKHVVEAEWLAYRQGRSFPPLVDTVSGFIERLAIRHGDGRASWGLGAIALVAERLLVAAPFLAAAPWPWLGALGDPARVGADLAALHQDWDEAGQPALSGTRGPELARFLSALHARLCADRARRPLGEAIRQLIDTVESPPEALAQELRRTQAVIVDDVLHPSPLRRELLVRLSRAWFALGVHVALCFESGPDLGGAEAARFFAYDDDEAAAFSLRPFAATRVFRHALFQQLVAEGGEAEIVIAGHDSVRTVEPGDPPGEAEPPDLVDRLYLEGGAVEIPASLRLQASGDPDVEVRGIARAVKERLLAGAPPEELCVAFPGLPAYVPVIRRRFAELGIPFALSAGRPALPRPMTQAVLAIATLPAEGFPVQETLALLGSDLVTVLPRAEASALARRCREEGVREIGRVDHIGVTQACAALAALVGDVEPRTWASTIFQVVREWGLMVDEARCPDPAVRAGSLQALGVALAAMEEVAADAASVDPGPWPARRLARLLRARLEAARIREPGSDEGRVQVVGMLELRGIHPKHLWIGGLLADDFPAREPDDYLVARAARRALDTLDPSDEARYLFASAIRNGLAEGHSLTLSWPLARDGSPVAPSPFVEDLLQIEGMDARLERVRHLPGGPLGAAELDAMLGEAAAAGVDPGAWAALAPLADGLEGRIVSRRDRTRFGAWDGILTRPPALPPSLGVTVMETYLTCPAKYLFARVLGADAESTWDPDLDPAARGTLLHAILQRFLDRLVTSGVPRLTGLDVEQRPTVRALLAACAEEALAEDEEIARLSPSLRAYHRERWLGGLVDGAAAGLLVRWLQAEIDRPWVADLHAREWTFAPVRFGPLAIRGRVDRVDRIGVDGVLVIDYKSGKAPAAAMVRAGLRIQGFVYAEAARAELGRSSAAAMYQELRGPRDVAATGWVGDAALVDRLAPDQKDRIALDADPDNALHDTFRSHLADAGARMAAGRFHTTLAGPKQARCDLCDYARACRVDHARNAAIRELEDPRWQAPLGPVEPDREEES